MRRTSSRSGGANSRCFAAACRPCTLPRPGLSADRSSAALKLSAAHGVNFCRQMTVTVIRTVLAAAKWSRIVFFCAAPCLAALAARRCALAASLFAFSATLHGWSYGSACALRPQQHPQGGNINSIPV